MAPTFTLGAPSTPDLALSIFGGVLELEGDARAVELGRGTVDEIFGVASGSLPAAFARFGSNRPPFYVISSADNECTLRRFIIPHNPDTPNEAPQHQAVYRRDS